LAELRFFRGWTEAELDDRLALARSLDRNFSTPFDRMTLERGWNHYYSDSVIAREEPGPPLPEGPFQRARLAVQRYEHSDPRIVTGHFDPEAPLLGRRMLLELKAWVMHYLVGVVVGAVRSDTESDQSVFGFRYDTLEGHFEVGAEWFLVTKSHETGDVHFRVDANWRTGKFPNWWSSIGFALLGARYQENWHRRAHARLSSIALHGNPEPLRGEGGLMHQGPEVTFKSFRGQR
jgi:uncharacterized protein (UPF0548 family)